MPSSASQLVNAQIGHRIFAVRGTAVLLDSDLAAAYGVATKVLNQAVKRNQQRFPADFAFVLTTTEAESLRSQTVTSNPGRGGRRHAPRVFTEHGAIMAASILNTPRAVQMSVFVVRAFVRLRDLARTHAELAKQLAAIERRVASHDESLKQVFATLRLLLQPPATPRRQIGFGTRGPSQEST